MYSIPQSIMSYDLTTYSTFVQHDSQCQSCSKWRHPISTHVPQLQANLDTNRLKVRVTSRKIRQLSLEVADLEKRVREATKARRLNLKYQLTYKLATYTGLLHMVLRYSVLLKQDIRRLQYLLSQANQPGPLPLLNFLDQQELDMAASAPNVGNLMMYDYYSQDADEAENEPEPEYSVITELFAALTHGP